LYPLTDFHGKLIIIDKKKYDKESIPRIIYNDWFKIDIEIKNICYNPQKTDGMEMELSFLLITPQCIYDFNTLKSYSILKYSRIEILLKYDDYTANTAIVKAMK
jgi:hypothetical protein